MRTEEMTSYSYAEDFILDKEKQIKKLVYSYTSQPNLSVADRSAIHQGTMVFNIIGDPTTKLKGEYWTARKTTGEIELFNREENLLEEFPNDLNPHPKVIVKNS